MHSVGRLPPRPLFPSPRLPPSHRRPFRPQPAEPIFGIQRANAKWGASQRVLPCLAKSNDDWSDWTWPIAAGFPWPLSAPIPELASLPAPRCCLLWLCMTHCDAADRLAHLQIHTAIRSLVAGGDVDVVVAAVAAW